MDERTDTLWNIYDSINAMIKFSDTKATAILAINGVILSLIFSNISQFLTLITDPLYLNLLIVSISIGAITGIASIGFSISCLIPRTPDSGKDDSMIFFGDIAKMDSPEDYSQSAQKILSKEGQLEEQILRSIWVTSQISSIKFRKVKWAVYLLGLTIFFLIVPLFTYVLSKIHF